MKIAFVGGRDIHILGGIESYMLNLSTELVKMGHEPIVFCESDHDGEEWVNGFKVIHQKGFKSNLICKPWLGIKATWRIIKEMKDVDFIHYNAWPPSLAGPLASLFGKKYLMQGHGLEWQRSKYSHFEQHIMKMMEWVTAHTNRNLIMCSDDQRSYFKKKYGRDAITIPTAVNLTDTSIPNNSDVLERFGLEKGKYFLFLARLVQDKNPDYLIKAFRPEEMRGYKLVIAGNNPANPTYVKKLHDLAEGNPGIVFTDAVYGEDKDQLLRNAFTFCIPSTIEGLSIALLEAMSYKLPILASDIPSNREVLEEDKAVWVRPENMKDLVTAFKDCIMQQERLQKAADYNYRKVISTYTWPKVTEKYIRTVLSIISKK